jgi:PAS domain S-box-containing protein
MESVKEGIGDSHFKDYPSEKNTFIAERLNELFRYWLRLASFWGAVIFISLSGLDYVSTPENFTHFLYYRVIIAIVLIAIAYVSKRYDDRSMTFHKVLAYMAVLGSAAAIEFMILNFGGHTSTYYVGQILLVICVTGFIPASLYFHIASLVLIYATYLLPILTIDEIADTRTFYESNIFLIAVMITSLFMRYLSGRSINKELAMKYDLSQDIIRRELAEDALREAHDVLEERVIDRTAELEKSEERFRAIFQNASDAIVLWGLNEKGVPSRLIDVNNRAMDMLGYTKEELLTMTPRDFVTPEHKPQIASAAEEIRTKGHGTFRMLSIRKDGRKVPVEISAHTFYLGNEKVSLSLVRDITERKKAEDELRESNALLDNIYSSTNVLFAYLDREFNFVNVNQAYADAGRKPKDYFIGKNHFDLYPHEENERIFREVVETGNPFSINEKQFEHPDQPERGTTYWDWSLIPVKDESGTVRNLVFSLNDVTEKVNMSKALRESEERFRLAFEDASVGSSITGTDGKILRVNEYFCNMLGYSEKELIGKTFNELTHPDDAELSSDKMKAMLADNGAKSSFEKRYIHKDGSHRWAIISPSLLRDQEGNPLCFITYVQDITERKLAEKKLKDNEQWFRALFNDAPDAIMIADPETGYIMNANQKAAELMGRPIEEIIGLHQSEIHPPEVKDYSKRTFRVHAEEKKEVKPVENFVVRPDGTQIPIEVLGHTFDVGGKQIIMGIFRDITERRKAEGDIRLHSEILDRLAEGVMMNRMSDGVIIYTNPTFEQIFGYGPGALLNEHVSVLNAPGENDPQAVVEEIIHDLNEFGMWVGEVHNIRADGTTFWSYASVTAFNHHEHGSVWVTVQQDITERRRTEKALKESEARYRTVVDDQTEFISRYHPDGTITFVNKAMCEHAGKEPEELIGRNFLDMLRDEDRAEVEQALKALDSENPVTSVEHKFVRPETGEVFWQRWINRAIFDEKGTIVEFQGVGCDITIERRAEDELRRSRDFIDKLVDSANVMLIGLDGNGRVILSNEMAERITGYSKEELTGKEWFQSMVPKDKYPEVWEVFELIASNKEYPEQFVNPIITKSGEERIISWRNSTLMEGGRLISTVSFGIDITNQMRIEENLRLQGEILNRMAEGVSLTNISNGTIIYTNTAYERMFGYGPGELINKHVSVLNAPFEKDPAEVANEIITSLKEHGTWSGEVHNVRTDGTTFWGYAHITTFDHYEYGNVWVTVQQDITDRKIAEMELIANREKLAAMSMELSMTEERERRNIASDLHDHIAQALAVTRVELGKISEQASGDASAKLDSMKTRIDQIINDTRSLIFDISPPVLYELGFKEAVDWLAEQFQEQHGIRIIVLAGKQSVQIDQEIRVILFKSVRELLMNVVKHAKATTIEVIITDFEENVHVQVKDDGIGFDASTIHDYLKLASFGILNLTERIKYIGGTIEFSSEQGQGTAVSIIVPPTHER